MGRNVGMFIILKIRFRGMIEVVLMVMVENETTERKRSLQ